MLKQVTAAPGSIATTLVIFTSDNGGRTLFVQLARFSFQRMPPLEGGLRMCAADCPVAWRGPGQDGQPSRRRSPMDLEAATMLAAG